MTIKYFPNTTDRLTILTTPFPTTLRVKDIESIEVHSDKTKLNNVRRFKVAVSVLQICFTIISMTHQSS